MEERLKLPHLAMIIVIVALTAMVAFLPAFKSYWVMPERSVLDQVLDTFVQPEYFSLQRQDLSGVWRLNVASYDEGITDYYYSTSYDDSSWGTVNVPFLYASTAFNSSLWLRRTFDLDGSLDGRRVKLIFNGAWLIADVWVNDRYLGKHYGYFSSFFFDVTPYLNVEGDNTLSVCLSSPVDVSLTDKVYVEGIYSDGNVKPYPSWASNSLPSQYEWYVPIGLWKGVELAYVGEVSVDVALLDERATGESSATVTLRLFVANTLTNDAGVDIGYSVSGYNFKGNNVTGVSRSTVKGSSKSWISFNIELPEVRLWWTWDQGEPNLYALDLNLSVGGIPQGHQSITFGVRTISGQISAQTSSLLLNNRFTFMRGGNYISDINLTRSTSQRLNEDLGLFKGANLNFIRVYAHVEPYELYKASDALGISVLADFPLTGSYLGVQPDQQTHDLFMEQAQREMVEMALMLYNSPSVIIYGVHNEPPWAISSYGDYFNERVNYEEDNVLQRLLSSIDATRLIITASGQEDEHLYYGWYNGEWTLFKTASTGFPTEFGAQSLPSNDSQFWSAVKVTDWPIGEESAEMSDLIYRDYQKDQWSATGVGSPSEFASLDAYIRASQEYQAALMKAAIERFRILKRNVTAGVTFFMLTDGFPSITWSILDYYRMPKQAYGTVAEAMKPTKAIVEWGGNYKIEAKYNVTYDGSSPIPLNLWVVNDDRSANGSVQLVWKIFDLTAGVSLLNGSRTFELPDSESPAVRVASIYWEPPAFVDRDHSIMFVTELKQGARTLDNDSFDFTLRASALLEITSTRAKPGETIPFEVLIDGIEFRQKDMVDGNLTMGIPGGHSVTVYGPGLGGDNVYLPMVYDLGTIAPSEIRKLEVQLYDGGLLNITAGVPAVESDEVLSSIYTILKGYPSQTGGATIQPLKVYMVDIKDAGSSWTEPDDLARGFKLAMSTWLSGIPIQYKTIATMQDLASLLRSNEMDVILINAHGQAIPNPEVSGFNPTEIFQLVTDKVSRGGWTIINTAGHPFSYMYFRGQLIPIGNDGMMGFASAFGVQLDVSDSDYPTQCSLSTDVQLALSTAGANVPSEAEFRSFIYSPEAKVVPLYVASDGSIGAGLLALGKGGFGFIGLGPEVDSMTKGYVAAALVFLKGGRQLNFTRGEPFIAEGFLYQYNSSNAEALAQLGLIGGKIVLPAEFEVSVRADVWSSSFSTSVLIGNGTKPFLLEPNQKVVSDDLVKSITTRNQIIVKQLLEQAREEVDAVANRGFYLGLEYDRLQKIEGYLSDYETSKSLEEGAFYLRSAYMLAEDVLSSISQSMNTGSVSILGMLLLISILSISLSSILSDTKEKSILMTILLFVVFLVLVQQTYPGFGGPSIGDITLGAYLVAIIFAATFLLSSFVGEAKTEGGVSLRAAIPLALSMAAGNLRRRKLRTLLALVSMTIMVVALSSLTSVSTTVTSTQLVTNNVAPQGQNLVLIKKSSGDFSMDDFAWILSQPEITRVAVKAENAPDDAIGNLGGNYPIYGLLGLEGESPQSDLIRSALDMPSGLDILYSNDLSVLISQQAAAKSQKTIGQKVDIGGLELTIVGIFDSSKFTDITDLDNSAWLPRTLGPVIFGGRPIQEVSPEYMIITNLKTSVLLGATPSTVYAYTKTSQEVIAVGQRISLLTGYISYVCPSGENIRYYYPSRSYTISGSEVLLPMGIIILNLALIMISNVYERRREISILSMVGLNPTHIFLLFVSEAFLLGFIGGTLGYISGFSVFKGMQLLGQIFPVDVKTTYFDMFAIVFVSVLTSVVSAVIPSTKASTLVTPSLTRRWRVEAEQKGVNVWSIPIPAKINEDKVSLFATHFYDRLKEYGGLSVEMLVSDPAIEEVQDELGRKFPKINFKFGRGGNRPFNSFNTVEFKRNELGSYDISLTTQLISMSGSYADNCMHDVGSFTRRLVLEWTSSKTRVIIPISKDYDYAMNLIRTYHPQQIIILTREGGATKIKELRSHIRAEGLWPPALEAKEVRSETASDLVKEITLDVERADMVCIDSDDGLLSSVLLTAAVLAKKRVGTVMRTGKFAEFQAEGLLVGQEAPA